MRLDHMQRPELNKGTVDFAVPEEYWAPHPPPRIAPLYQPIIPLSDEGIRKPQSMDYVFAIDVSAEAIRSGFTSSACVSLLRTLYGETSQDGSVVLEPCISPHCRIGILAYDRTLYFYNLSVRVWFLPINAPTSLISCLPSLVLNTRKCSLYQILTMSSSL